MYSVSVKILEQESGPARVALKLVCSGKIGRAYMVWQSSVWSISKWKLQKALFLVRSSRI